MEAALSMLTQAERNALLTYARIKRVNENDPSPELAVARVLGFWREPAPSLTPDGEARKKGGGQGYWCRPYRAPSELAIERRHHEAVSFARREIERIKDKLRDAVEAARRQEAARRAAATRAAHNGGAERRKAMATATAPEEAHASELTDDLDTRLEESLAEVEERLEPLLTARERIRSALRALRGEGGKPDPAERLDEREEEVPPPAAPEKDEALEEERLDEREEKATPPRKAKVRSARKGKSVASRKVPKGETLARPTMDEARDWAAKQVGWVSGGEFMAAFSCKRALSTHRLRALVEEGALEKSGKGAGTKYRRKEAATPDPEQAPEGDVPGAAASPRAKQLISQVRSVVTRDRALRDGAPFTAELLAERLVVETDDRDFQVALNYWVEHGSLKEADGQFTYVRRVPDPHAGQRNGGGSADPEGVGAEATPGRGRTVPGTGGKLVGTAPR